MLCLSARIVIHLHSGKLIRRTGIIALTMVILNVFTQILEFMSSVFLILAFLDHTSRLNSRHSHLKRAATPHRFGARNASRAILDRSCIDPRFYAQRRRLNAAPCWHWRRNTARNRLEGDILAGTADTSTCYDTGIARRRSMVTLLSQSYERWFSDLQRQQAQLAHKIFVQSLQFWMGIWLISRPSAPPSIADRMAARSMRVVIGGKR